MPTTARPIKALLVRCDMLAREDIEQILDQCDLRYISKDCCDDKMDKERERIEEMNKNIVGITTKLNFTLGILSAIGAGVLGIVIELLFK